MTCVYTIYKRIERCCYFFFILSQRLRPVDNFFLFPKCFALSKNINDLCRTIRLVVVFSCYPTPPLVQLLHWSVVGIYTYYSSWEDRAEAINIMCVTCSQVRVENIVYCTPDYIWVIFKVREMFTLPTSHTTITNETK